jgi:hypothetical protein
VGSRDAGELRRQPRNAVNQFGVRARTSTYVRKPDSGSACDSAQLSFSHHRIAKHADS